jgi:hypothetical protein
MLEYLLVRPADREDIFADHRCRFLVLDEVHTYRGSLGANIALLVRRLRAHLDGARQNWNVDAEQSRRFPKLIHVGTSATIKSIDEAGKTPEDVAKERDTAVQGFFSTLAGVESGSIRVIGEEKCDLTIPDGARWTQNPQVPKFNLEIAMSIRQAVQQLAGADQGTSLAEAASSAAILFKLNELLARKPLSIEKAVDCIIEEVPERKLSLRDSVRGEVAAALSLGSSLPDGMPGALRLRTHRFIRGGWKFFRCVDPKCGALQPGEDRGTSRGRRTRFGHRAYHAKTLGRQGFVRSRNTAILRR